jgi:hypothetical protein
MEEHGVSHLRDGTDGTFGETILMVSPNAAKVDILFHGGDVVFEGLGGKDPIVGAIPLNGDPSGLSGPLFE